MNLSVIVAASENNVIGRGGGLPWRLPADLKRFKRLTMGHTLIMGRKTWESIGRPLPGRRSIVISRQADYETGFEEVLVAKSLDEALALAGESQVFVIGGAAIYEAALPRASRLYLTRVHAEVEGDVYLPEIDWSVWRLVEEERHPAEGGNEFRASFLAFERAKD